MNGLNQVRDAVIDALKNAGIAAMAAYEGEAKEHEGPVASVDVAAAEGKPVGLSGYLGEKRDESGSVRELYGMQMDVIISLSVRATKASECETALEVAAGALMETLPAGLKLEKMSWNGIAWDKATGMFLRKGSAACRAVFLAEDLGDTGTLLDFILKGTIKK
ncbi:hypothetical protein [Oscillibacter sp.]|uniref:hypothetical protein n=1 Tax=Oscillibacter sp. TaxID=1945593 RepID=UPI0028AD6CE0|nr:hypothetical protein [Oscillibacter sp.]